MSCDHEQVHVAEWRPDPWSKGKKYLAMCMDCKSFKGDARDSMEDAIASLRVKALLEEVTAGGTL